MFDVSSGAGLWIWLPLVQWTVDGSFAGQWITVVSERLNIQEYPCIVPRDKVFSTTPWFGLSTSTVTHFLPNMSLLRVLNYQL